MFQGHHPRFKSFVAPTLLLSFGLSTAASLAQSAPVTRRALPRDVSPGAAEFSKEQLISPAAREAGANPDICPDGFVASTDRTAYSGTITVYDTLADAMAGTNPRSGPHAIPARDTDPPLNTGDRDVAIYVLQNGADFDPSLPNANLILTAWYYTLSANTNGFPKDDPAGDRLYSGWDNPNNTNVGFLQLYDEDGNRTVSKSGTFSDFDGSFWRKFNLAVELAAADYPDDFARLWNAPGANNFGVVTDGIFHVFELNAEFDGLEGIVTAPGSIESNSEPTGVTGTIHVIFENVYDAGDPNDDPQWAGFYVADLTISLDSWVFAQDSEDLNGDFIPSYFASFDSAPPIAVCQNAVVQLDASGAGSITVDDVDGGSSDDCAIQSRSVSPDTFSCADVGEHEVTLTVTDEHGNESTCTATVSVQDTVAPDAHCQNVTVILDENGAGSVDASQVDDGSDDACGIFSYALSQDNFDCTDLGDNEVTLTVTDNNSNTESCTATVMVVDQTPPEAVCQNVILQLNANGLATLSPAAVGGGSTDNCSVSLSLSRTDFDCDDVGKPHEVTITATDSSGNTDTCTANVTVRDDVPPVALCHNITVSLDATGHATITPEQIDNFSKDACGVASLSLSQTSFNCCDVGQNQVTLFVTDVNGNQSTCTSIVTVLNPNPPIGVCERGDMNCDGCLTVSDIGPFVLAVTNSNAYLSQFPNCEILRGDYTNDGFVTVGDIGHFVMDLTTP